MRLIDADALMGMDIKIGYIGEKTVRAVQRATVDAIYRNIGNSPTVDAVPVRHGEWIKKSSEEAETLALCSTCSYPIWWWHKTYFCPNCGAKMYG